MPSLRLPNKWSMPREETRWQQVLSLPKKGGLLGSLVPSTTPKRRLAHNLRDEVATPLRGELQKVGRELVDELQLQARHAADNVRDEVTDEPGSTLRVKRSGNDTGQTNESSSPTR